jgi:hypothetical protein
MIIYNDAPNVSKNQEILVMKKLMTLMLGLSLALGSVAVSFAQDTTKKSSKKKSSKKKKSTDTTKAGR